jgi:iron transport multicopper oxidase
MLTSAVNILVRVFLFLECTFLTDKDGFRGPMIIHDPAAPFKYDDESILTLTDLYHDQAPLLINYYLSPDNENNYGGTEPVPNANLINEAENVKFSIIAGKTYLFHIINMGAYASQWLQFGGHNMTIVEVDGVYTQPYNVSQLFVAPAQRYSVLIHAKTTTTQNFVVVAQMETDMFDATKTPANQKTTVSLAHLMRWLC